ncbi:MAG: sigma-70 family RNA polymerase sigma factor [Ruminiclostridium sp.]|nr:sigma-70 family RNA polymerase sigma factor [Ruminiclostridium sp.]
MRTEIEKLSDEELLKNIKSTDKISSDEAAVLVERYMNVVKVKALTTAKRCPSADFDDLYSDGLMGLLKAIRYYDEKKGASFATFASLCVDTSMRTCVAKALKISPANKDDDFDFDSLQDEGKSTDDIIIDKEQNGEFYKKLGEILTDKEMAVLDMYLRHYSYQQIGEALGIKEKSVDNALQRAKSKIKHNLGK